MAGPTPQTRHAKQLFLYGNGDGQRVTNVPALAKLSGVTENTIRTYLPDWEKEAEDILINSSSMGLALSLGAKELQLHNSDMNHLRDQISQVKFEMDSLEKITARLADWLDKFEGDDVQIALQIFSDWQRACGQKSSLRSQFLAMQKQWTSLVGIVDLRDIEVVRAKEIAKGKAKLSIKELESNQGTRDATPAGFFSRDRVEILED